jgi:hypothetical protein
MHARDITLSRDRVERRCRSGCAMPAHDRRPRLRVLRTHVARVRAIFDSLAALRSNELSSGPSGDLIIGDGGTRAR